MRLPKSLADAIFKDIKKRWNPACRAVTMDKLDKALCIRGNPPLCQWVWKQTRKTDLPECTGCPIWDGKPMCCLEIRNIMFYIGIDDFKEAIKFTGKMRDRLARIMDDIDMEQSRNNT